MQAIVTPLLRWTGVSILTLPLTITALPAQQAERYSIPGGDVAIYNLAGELRVEAGSGAVTAELTRGGADAAKLKIAQGEIDEWQTLRIIYPADRIHYGQMSEGGSTQLRVREDGTFNDRNDGDDDEDHGPRRKERGKRITITNQSGGLDAHADVRVTVPEGKRVAIYLAVGKVSVTNVGGELSVNASSAPVTTSQTRGELNIEVGSGAVQVSDARGELNVDTGSGSVSVSSVRGETISVESGSGDVTASDIRSNELKVETGSGDIQVTKLLAPQVALNTGSGSVVADLQGELWNVNVETGSGDVSLKLPPTVGANVDIQSSSGDIETDFSVSVTRHARDHLTGTIGDGRGKIAIETGSGGIKLLKNQ
jgi:lia operon protein LiaG